MNIRLPHSCVSIADDANRATFEPMIRAQACTTCARELAANPLQLQPTVFGDIQLEVGTHLGHWAKIASADKVIE